MGEERAAARRYIPAERRYPHINIITGAELPPAVAQAARTAATKPTASGTGGYYGRKERCRTVSWNQNHPRGPVAGKVVNKQAGDWAAELATVAQGQPSSGPSGSPIHHQSPERRRPPAIEGDAGANGRTHDPEVHGHGRDQRARHMQSESASHGYHASDLTEPLFFAGRFSPPRDRPPPEGESLPASAGWTGSQRPEQSGSVSPRRKGARSAWPEEASAVPELLTELRTEQPSPSQSNAAADSAARDESVAPAAAGQAAETASVKKLQLGEAPAPVQKQALPVDGRGETQRLRVEESPGTPRRNASRRRIVHPRRDADATRSQGRGLGNRPPSPPAEGSVSSLKGQGSPTKGSGAREAEAMHVARLRQARQAASVPPAGRAAFDDSAGEPVRPRERSKKHTQPEQRDVLRGSLVGGEGVADSVSPLAPTSAAGGQLNRREAQRDEPPYVPVSDAWMRRRNSRAGFLTDGTQTDPFVLPRREAAAVAAEVAPPAQRLDKGRKMRERVGQLELSDLV